jgi:long-chain fatty acid transport protein
MTSVVRCRCDRHAGALALVTLLGAATRVQAAGFASARFGGELGHPLASNPTALYYNPAGIGFSQGTSFFADGVVALRQGSWQHALAPTERADPADAAGANTGTATFRNVFGGPMLGGTTRLGDLALGGAFFVPFGGRSHWDKNPSFAGATMFPLAHDGVQRWHNIDGAITVAYLTAGAAYRLGPLSLGATVNVIRSSIDQGQAKNIVGNGEPDTTREGRIDLSVSGWHGSFGLGLMWEAIAGALWLGASYQAQPGLGEMALSGSLVTRYEGSTSPFAVDLRQALPDITRWGARWRAMPQIELRLFGDFTRWSVLQTQCISLRGQLCAVDPSGADVTADGSTVQNLRRHWRNTWGVRGGLSFWPRPEIEILLGGGAEKGAPPAATLEPSLMDADNLQGAIGTRIALGPTLFAGATYTQLHYFPRDNTGRSELPAAELPTRRADAGGRYELSLSLFQVSLEKRF